MPAKPKATPSTTRVAKSKRKNNKESALTTQVKPVKRTSARLASALESTAPESTMSSNTAQNATSSTEQKKKDGPVYFWQPHQGHGYLGQWFPTPFEVDGETYATAEMWMMVQKARLFKDEGIAKKMLETFDPKTHKDLGRQVSNFNEAKWNEHKLVIVERGNYHKFTISEDAENLRGLLLSTGDRELVEASPRDKIWGIGFAEKNAPKNRHKWGQNLLGITLMNVRKRLREEAEKKEKDKDGEWVVVGNGE